MCQEFPHIWLTYGNRTALPKLTIPRTTVLPQLPILTAATPIPVAIGTAARALLIAEHRSFVSTLDLTQVDVRIVRMTSAFN